MAAMQPRHQQQRAEPMNASSSHPKVKVALAFSERFYVAGGAITGKMELESRADKGLGLGVIMLELVAIEELTSRDHSATSVFMRSRRVYQGPGVPPSNAVLPHPLAGEPPLPAGYLPARKGRCNFFFKLPVPADSPGTIAFGNGLARVKYEVRATVGVVWKGERRLVNVKEEVELLEGYREEDATDAKGVVVGEGGKIWVQAEVVGGLVVAGESACVQLHVKNQSAKKTAGVTLALTRHLHLPAAPAGPAGPPLELSDTLATVSFKGAEYSAPPGQEGVATLVFDVPPRARTVHSYPRPGGDLEPGSRDALFALQATLNIRVAMPMGSKDIQLDLPVSIYHPVVLPEPEQYDYDPAAYPALPLSPAPQAMSPNPYERALSPYDRVMSPYDRAMSPYAQPYPNQLWSPPPLQMQMPTYTGMSANPHALLYSPPPPDAYYYSPPPPHMQPPVSPPRPASAEPPTSAPIHSLGSSGPVIAGLPPAPSAQHPVLMHSLSSESMHVLQVQAQEQERNRDESKGLRASRVSNHLRMSSRGRSISPASTRYSQPKVTPPIVPLQQGTSLSPHSPHASPGAGISPPSQHAQYRNRPPSLTLGPLSPVSLHSGSGSGEVVSPRPMPSPKMAVPSDPLANALAGGSLGKTARVAHLEAVAELVPRDMSGDAAIPPVDGHDPKEEEMTVAELLAAHDSALRADAAQDKTLPSPPVPTDKPHYAGATPVLAQRLFVSNAAPEPRTPTLSALSLLKPPRSAPTQASADALSGLDALERRLLAEVGTRKVPAQPRTDVRDLGLNDEPLALDTSPNGLAIPPGQSQSDEAVNDSAISSLSLGAEGVWDHLRAREEEKKNENTPVPPPAAFNLVEREDDDLSDGRTHRAASSSDERRTTRRGGKSDTERRAHKSGDERRAHKSGDERPRTAGSAKKRSRVKDAEKDKTTVPGTKEKEAHRLRKAAKGRVAEWLGRIDAKSPPVVSPEVFASDSPAASPRVAEMDLEPEVSARRRKSSASAAQLHKQAADLKATSAAIHRTASQQKIGADEETTAEADRSANAEEVAAVVHDLVEESKSRIISKASPGTTDNAASNRADADRLTATEPEPAKRAPDPRSSGFVPMATMRARASVFKPLPTSTPTAKPVRARWEAALAASSVDPDGKSRPPAVVRKLSSAGKPLPVYLQPNGIGDGPKYDIRSARGGRGGRVTAATALWAGLTEQEKKQAEKAEKAERLEREKEIDRKLKVAATRPQAFFRNTAGKAAPAVSSSAAHAAPHLSSTASLSRPAPTRARVTPRMPPAIVEETPSAPVLSRASSGRTEGRAADVEAKAPRAELAFGQARLRDLIRKYQTAGQA